jgi:hypothetical protein
MKMRENETKAIRFPQQFELLFQKRSLEKKLEFCFALFLGTQAARIVYKHTKVSGHIFEFLGPPVVTFLSELETVNPPPAC